MISDGDLRRWMEKTEKTGENLLSKKAREIMTRNPKVIAKDALAAEAVAIMENSSITCLIILDADGTTGRGDPSPRPAEGGRGVTHQTTDN